MLMDEEGDSPPPVILPNEGESPARDGESTESTQVVPRDQKSQANKKIPNIKEERKILTKALRQDSSEGDGNPERHSHASEVCDQHPEDHQVHEDGVGSQVRPGRAGTETSTILWSRSQRTSASYGMEISAEKTKRMTNKTNGIKKEIKANDQKLETVSSFKQ